MGAGVACAAHLSPPMINPTPSHPLPPISCHQPKILRLQLIMQNLTHLSSSKMLELGQL